MALPGKISVELTLLLDKLRQQAKQVPAIIKQEVSKAGGGGMAVAADKATASQDKLTASVKRTNKALSEQQQRMKDIASGKLSPVEPGMKVSLGGVPNNPAAAAAAQAAAQAAADAFGKSTNAVNVRKQGLPSDMPQTLAMAMRMVNPSGPHLPNVPFPALPSAGPSGWQKYSKMLPGLAAGIGTAVGGPLGGAISGVLTKMNPVIATVTASMTALRFSIQQTMEAFKRAQEIYIRSMVSGMGLGMQSKRSTLANVIGVSENDIFMFGAAISQFNDKLTVAQQTIVATTPILAYTTMHWRVMMENIKAIWMQVAAAVAPAVNRIIGLVTAMVKLHVLAGTGKLIGLVISNLIEAITRVVAFSNIAVAGVLLIFTSIKDGINNTVQFIINQISRIPGVGKLGLQKGDMPGFGNTKEAAKAFVEVLKAAFARDNVYSQTSDPMAYMKQMRASSLEKMGLQVGAGGGTNYSAQTAKNTSKTVTLLEKVSGALTANKPNITRPAGLPAGA